MSSLQEHIARHERAEGGITMSEQDEGAWGRAAREELAESQQQRIRELEQQALKDARENTALQRERDQYAEEWADADAFAKVNAMNAADYFTACAERDALREQLAARDAVIAEALSALRDRDGDPAGRIERILRAENILAAAPETVLAEHDAQVLEEAANAYEALPEDSRTYFPKIHGRWLRERAANYRNGATHE